MTHPERATTASYYWALVMCLMLLAACRLEVPSDRARFVFLHSAKADRAAFVDRVSSCEGQSKAFADLLGTLNTQPPLTIEVSRGNRALFGQAFQERSYRPRLMIDLQDLGRLPDAADAMKWAPDSSWAWTKCEVLGHEVAEGVRYRELWGRSTELERAGIPDTAFTIRRRNAHAYALQVERAIAEDQRTRLDADAQPYSRNGECGFEGVIHILFGNSTETLVLDGEASPAMIVFSPGRNRCSEPSWRDSAVAIQRRFRASLPQP